MITLAQIVLLVLKLTGTVTWSWYVVLIPTWIAAAIVAIPFLLMAAAGAALAVSAWWTRRGSK